MTTSDDVKGVSPFADELTFWIQFCNHYLEKHDRLPDNRGVQALVYAASAYLNHDDNHRELSE